MTDLETTNPNGNLAVLIYRGLEKLTRHIETQSGLSGIWDNLKPHVNEAVANNMGNVELPTEAKVLLSILQANYNVKRVNNTSSNT